MIQVRHPGGRRSKTVRHLPSSLQNFDDVDFDGANRFWIVNVSSIKSYFEPPLPLFLDQCPVYTKEDAQHFPQIGQNFVLAKINADEIISDGGINSIKESFPKGVGLRVMKSGMIHVLYRNSSDLYSDADLGQLLPDQLDRESYSMVVLGEATTTLNDIVPTLSSFLTSTDITSNMAIHPALPPLSPTVVSPDVALKAQEVFSIHFYPQYSNSNFPNRDNGSLDSITRQALIEGCEYRWHRGSPVVDRSLLWRTTDDNQHHLNTADALGSILCLGRPTDDMTRPICLQNFEISSYTSWTLPFIIKKMTEFVGRRPEHRSHYYNGGYLRPESEEEKRRPCGRKHCYEAALRAHGKVRNHMWCKDEESSFPYSVHYN